MKEEKLLQQSRQNRTKKTYVKPILNKVQLVAGEAVLALCKDGAGGACLPDVSCASDARS